MRAEHYPLILKLNCRILRNIPSSRLGGTTKHENMTFYAKHWIPAFAGMTDKGLRANPMADN